VLYIQTEDGTDDYMMWNSNDEDGKARSVRKMTAVTVKMNTVTLIGKSTQNLTCFVYKVCAIIHKILFLSRLFFFLGGGGS
jgi:hypothetical protein